MAAHASLTRRRRGNLSRHVNTKITDGFKCHLNMYTPIYIRSLRISTYLIILNTSVAFSNKNNFTCPKKVVREIAVDFYSKLSFELHT